MLFYYSHTRPVCRLCFPTWKNWTIKRNCLPTRRRNSATGELNHVQLHDERAVASWHPVSYWNWLRLGKTWVIAGARNSFFIISLRAARARESLRQFINVSAGRLSSGNAWILKARTAQKSKVSGEIFCTPISFRFLFEHWSLFFSAYQSRELRKKPDLRSSAMKRAALKRKTSRAGMLNLLWSIGPRQEDFFSLLQISSNR